MRPQRRDPPTHAPWHRLPGRAARKYDRSIVEGPLGAAVWRLAWPTMLQNAIGGLQGIIDHAMVGHYVGFAANAAIGVSWQIFLVVIVFISSLFTGMSVLVARFAGAGDTERVNRTVYQAFLTAVALSLAVLAPLGYALAPLLLGLVNAAPEVRAQALPYLRILFVYSSGMLIFFMLGGALRSAGDARTPLRLGAAVTVLNIVAQFRADPGTRTDTGLRDRRRRDGDRDRDGSRRGLRARGACRAECGSCGSRRAAACGRTGRSFARCFVSGCRRVCRRS